MNSFKGPLITKPIEEEFGVQEIHVMHQSMPMASSRGRRSGRSKSNITPTSSSSSSWPTIMRIISAAILFTSSCLSISSYSAANAQQSATAVTSTPRFKSPTAYHHRNSAHKLERKLARRTRPQQQQQKQKQRTLQSQTICSCAPRSFTITLDLLNNCFDDTIQSNVGGINETDCTIQFGDDDDFGDGMDEIEGIVGGGMSKDDDDTASGDGNVNTNSEVDFNVSNELHVNRPTTINGLKPETLAMINEILADIPWLTNAKGTTNKHEERPTRQKKQNRSERKRGERKRNRSIQKGSNRHLQGPATPVVINSVSFIEVNSVGVVINVEIISTNVEFITGSSFEITSVSSLLSTDIPIEDQLDFIPDTTVLFLVGTNSQGEEVRGRFVWRYTNSCSTDAVAIQEGDVLAWNEWSEVEDQLGDFCPANGGGVTSAPVPVGLPTNSPVATLDPSASPTLEPTPMAIPFPTFVPTSLPTITEITSFPTLMPTTDPVTATPTATPTTAPNTPLPTMIPTEPPTTENSPTPSPTTEDNPTRGPSSYMYSRPTFMSMPPLSNGDEDSNIVDNLLNYFEGSSDISSTYSGSSSSSNSSNSNSKSSRKGHTKSGKRKKMKRQTKRSKSGKISSKEWHFVSDSSSSISSSKNGKRNKARSKGKRSSERSSSHVSSSSSSSSVSSSSSESSGSSGRSHRSSSGSKSVKSAKKI